MPSMWLSPKERNTPELYASFPPPPPPRWADQFIQSAPVRSKREFDRHFWRKAGDAVILMVAAAVAYAYWLSF